MSHDESSSSHPPPEFTLTGKVALVTGAARGTGRACAMALAQAGADVVLGMRWLRDESFHTSLLSRIPLGRVGEPIDVADAVVFLASPAASLINGSTLLIDGGWTAESRATMATHLRPLQHSD